MAAMKNWKMDMEDAVVFAIEHGAQTHNDVLNYVKTELSVVDEQFVVDFTNELMGPYPDVTRYT